MFRSLTRSVLLVLSLAAGPVAADGSLSLTLSPRTAQEAQVMRFAMDLYALHHGQSGGATVRQQGQGNTAGLQQSGLGQWALIDQRGSGHQGTIAQSGQGNAWALFQSGRNTTAAVRQGGTGQVGITVVHGW